MANPFGLSENPFVAGHDTRLIFQYEKRIEAVTLLRRANHRGRLVRHRDRQLRLRRRPRS